MEEEWQHLNLLQKTKDWQREKAQEARYLKQERRLQEKQSQKKQREEDRKKRQALKDKELWAHIKTAPCLKPQGIHAEKKDPTAT